MPINTQQIIDTLYVVVEKTGTELTFAQSALVSFGVGIVIGFIMLMIRGD